MATVSIRQNDVTIPMKSRLRVKNMFVFPRCCWHRCFLLLFNWSHDKYHTLTRIDEVWRALTG